MRDSYGTFIWPNGNRYEGEWHESKRQGQGVMLYSNKDVYYGHFEDGRKHKFGIYKFFSGTVYQGYWERGRLHGTYDEYIVSYQCRTHVVADPILNANYFLIFVNRNCEGDLWKRRCLRGHLLQG